MKRLVDLFRSSMGGSVLMEYLVVNLAIAVPIVMFWHLEMFNPSENKWVGHSESEVVEANPDDQLPIGRYRNTSNDWENRVGTRIQWMFQRVSSGIALPVP